MISIEKYFQENLNTDDGTKWRKMLSHVFDKANLFQFSCGPVDANADIERKIAEAKEHVASLGFSQNIDKVYATRFHCQKIYEWNYIIVRLNLDSKLRAKISSYKTVSDFVLQNDDDIFDPAFYFNETALLWTVTSMSYANLLLSHEEKLKWQKDGFSFDFENNAESPTQKMK